MRAWSGEGPERAGARVEGAAADAMGPSVEQDVSARPRSPPLKNGSDLREAGYLIAVGSRTARFRRKHTNKLLITVLLVLVAALLCLAVVMTVLYARKRLAPAPFCETKQCLRSAANLALSMDPSAEPCQDFYQFACGNWAEEHPRPDSLRSYDWFREKQMRVYARVRDVLTRNVTYATRPVQQAKELFDACMDTETLDKRGLKPVTQILESLGLPSYPTYINLTEGFDYSTYTFDWVDVVIKIKTILGMDVLIGFDIFADPKNSSVYRLVLGSPETVNPFPSIFIEKKRRNARKIFKYQAQTLRTTYEAFGLHDYRSDTDGEQKDEEDKPNEIYKLFYAELIKLFVAESDDLKVTNLSETEMDQNIFLAANEYYSIYNDMCEMESESDNTTENYVDTLMEIPEYTIDEIQAHTDSVVEANGGAPAPIWKRYLEGVFSVSAVSLDFENDKALSSKADLKYLSLMAAYVANTSPVRLELYVWVKVVEVMAEHTTSELRALLQRVREKTRGEGEGSSPPRSMQCVDAANDMLGMAVAHALADTQFLNNTKPKIQVMLNELKNALARLVGKANWMDDDTKLATYQKIVQMKTLIGYPEWLHEPGRLEEYYSGVEVTREEHLQNLVNIIQVKIRKALNRLRERKNFTWATDPTEVNAYHTFQENTITIPMVMLQHPFFDLGLDSLNYGSLGTVLGHEIMHGFDNFGRQFDHRGNFVSWWSNATLEGFYERAGCFRRQYSAFTLPELGEQVDGMLTLGENIADNGGMREALHALREHLRKRSAERRLPGFGQYSSEQLFFLSFANLWCGSGTPDSLRADLRDEHAPQRFRALGALHNSADFARAWRCRADAPMSPPTRCIIF